MKYPLLLYVVAMLPLFLFSAPVFAATYPASCPAEAHGILEAVGGCAAVNESDYGAIYAQCCRVTEMPTSLSPASTPSEESATATSVALLVIVGLFSVAYIGIHALVRSRKKEADK